MRGWLGIGSEERIGIVDFWWDKFQTMKQWLSDEVPRERDCWRDEVGEDSIDYCLRQGRRSSRHGKDRGGE